MTAVVAAAVAVPANAEVAMDRFVSASSVQDAVQSLQSILDGFDGKSPETAAAPLPWESSWIWQHEDFAEHMIHLLQHAQLRSNQSSVEDDESITLILKLYLSHLGKDVKVLKLPAPGRLLEALLDVMDNHTQRSSYTRVLALRVLELLSRNHSSLANTQWLQAPNALHRLADTLTLDLDNPLEEPVRNQALLVAQLLATSAPMAKVFLFAEVETSLLDMGWRLYGGLTGGNPAVLDILTFLKELVGHADPALQDLLWQRPALAPRLAQLLDLRGGRVFLNPSEITSSSSAAAAASTTVPSSNAKSSSKPTLGPLSQSKNTGKQPPQNDDSDDDDDLDALLQTRNTTNKNNKQKATAPSQEQETATDKNDNSSSAITQPSIQDLPRLLEAEEQVIIAVLEILDRLLESETLRPTVWKQHAGLCSLVWELALVNPMRPPVCALPSAALQQRALEIVALKFHHAETMDRHSGLDRLLYLVCTGGGIANTLEQRLGVSQAALTVLRRVLDPSRIHEILLHTLAPPPLLEDEDVNMPQQQQQHQQQQSQENNPTVVQKLWNTVAENIVTLSSPHNDEEPQQQQQQQLDMDQKTLFISGALGGLAVFLADAESREMVFKVTPDAANLDHLLEVLADAASYPSDKGTPAAANAINSTTIQWSLYRFLCEYIYETPRLVQTLLSSTASTHLATLANPKLPTAPLVYLLLGLAMEYYPPEATECGGWTRASILQVLQSVGISKVTKALEGLKQMTSSSSNNNNKAAANSASNASTLLPWSMCDLEAKYWDNWYQKAVWVVRKRIVRELTGGSNEDDMDDDDEKEATTTIADSVKAGTDDNEGDATTLAKSTEGIRPLRKLIAQQSVEIDDLRLQLEEAQAKIASQDHQLETWQRRMKSTPTELDSLLSELTDKTSKLELEIVSLQNDAKRKQEEHDKEIADLTQKLQEERDEQTKLREAEQEAKDERDQMEQELQSVSQAYASLEEEFRKSVNNAALTSSSTAQATEGGAPTGETEASTPSSAQQSQGEASNQTPGSTEVSTLKAENARLRQDARAADEWMAMAVQRINEMGAQQAQLTQQVATLQGQLITAQQQAATTNTAQQQLDSYQSQYEEKERALIQQVDILQEKLRVEQNTVSALKQELEALSAQHAEEVEKAVELAENAWSEEKNLIEKELDELRKEVEEPRESPQDEEPVDSDLTSFVEQLQVELNAKATDINRLEEELELAQRSSTAVLSDGDEGDTPVKQQLEAALKEVEAIRHKSQEDIYKKEATIRELQDRLSSGLGGYSLKDIQERDEEIAELQAANTAAQDWMSKAVEHHQLLQEQVATLTEEKNQLANALNQGQQIQGNGYGAATKLMENELNEKTLQLEALEAQLAAKEVEIKILRDEIDASQDMKQDIGIAREDVQVLKKQLDEARTRAEQLETKLSENALTEENETLKAKVEELESQLEEFQSWADMVQQKIAEIMSSKETAESALSAAQQELTTRDMEIEALKGQISGTDNSEENLPPETEADKSVIDQLKQEMEQLGVANLELSNERNALSEKYQVLEKSFKELQAQMDEAQQRITELQTAKENRETELQAATPVPDGSGEVDSVINETVQHSLEAPLAAEDYFGVPKAAPVPSAGAENVAGTISEPTPIDVATDAAFADTASPPSREGIARAPSSAAEEFFGAFGAHSEEQQANGLAEIEAPSGESPSISELQDKIRVLESEIETLQSTLHSKQTEADSVVAQWQESHQQVEQRAKELELQLEQLRSNGVAIDKDEPTFGDNSSDMAREVQRLENELRVALDTIAKDEDVVRQWQDRVTELEDTIQTLEKQIEDEQKAATDAISQWQETYSATEARCEQLETQMQQMKNTRESGDPLSQDSSDNAAPRPDSNLQQSPESFDAADFFLSEPAKPLSEEPTEDTRNENQQDSDNKVLELEAEIESLKNQLNRQEQEANDVLAQWQENHSIAEGRGDKLFEELNVVLTEKETLSTSLEKLEREYAVLVEQKAKLEASIQSPENSIPSEHLPSGTDDYAAVASETMGAKEDELLLARQSLAEAEEAIRQWEERSAELEAELDALNDVVSNRHHETELAISQWRDKVTTLEERCRELEEELAAVGKEKQSWQQESLTPDEKFTTQESEPHPLLEDGGSTGAAGQIPDGFDGQMAGIERTIMELREELEVRKRESEETIETWQKSCSELRHACSELEEKILIHEQDLKDKANAIVERDTTIATLKSEVERLENQESNAQSTSTEVRRLEEELMTEKGLHQEARDEIEVLSRALEETRAALDSIGTESEEVVSKWTERVEELEAQVFQLEEQLAEQETDANTAISTWEAKAEELEQDLETVTEELRKAVSTVEEQNEINSRLQNNLSELMESFDKQTTELEKLNSENVQVSESLTAIEENLQSLQSRYDDLTKSEEALRHKLEKTENELHSIKEERDNLKALQEAKSRDTLEEERDRLTIVIAQLEEELNEANGMLQTYITDGSSSRAAEAAAMGLREEVEDLKNQVDDYRRAAEEERRHRENANLEIDRLRDDIAALVSLNSQEIPSDEIQQRTAKAVERLKMKERIEIEQIRKSLFRTIEEVELARAAEKLANETLAKVRLQTSLAEQEVVSAKSEINFLTQALEELRQAEESKRASLEYRIGSLEDENDVLRKYHFTELETVRNELAQVAMEKDRILNQLRESEKNNSAFVLATPSADGPDNKGVSDIDAEIKRLRIENAYLLNVAADDKARAERRLREVLAAHRATAEADTILEHELRVAAESTIQNLKSQLEDLGHAGRSHMSTSGSGSVTDVHENAERMSKELEGLREELQSLKNENSSLKAKMEEAASKAKSEISTLTEEWRQAQAKARKLEREGRYDSAIHSEVAKLRMSPEKRVQPQDEWTAVNGDGCALHDENPASEGMDQALLSAEAYDLIRKQKEEIQEERKMYLEFLAEHDNLLALLAQQDLERACLKDALLERAGVETVESVLRDVEEKALAQFGNVVRVL